MGFKQKNGLGEILEFGILIKCFVVWVVLLELVFHNNMILPVMYLFYKFCVWIKTILVHEYFDLYELLSLFLWPFFFIARCLLGGKVIILFPMFWKIYDW